MKVTVTSFQAWLTGAQKGSQIVYHKAGHAYGEVCQAAMSASNAGLVNLVQRAVKGPMGLRTFEYIAQRTIKGIKKR